MGYSALLLVHVAAATAALLSGFAALYLRKGASPHRMTGTAFLGSMLVMTASAIALALVKSEMINVIAASLTIYMVATGWLVVRRKVGQPGLGEALLLSFGVAVAVGAFAFGWYTSHGASAKSDTLTPAVSFVFATLALFSTVLDASLFVRGGPSAAHRLARHIWRLCSALLFTATAFFTPTRFSLPQVLTSGHLNYVPLLYVAAAMIFWLARVLFGNAFTTRRPRGAASDIRPQIANLGAG